MPSPFKDIRDLFFPPVCPACGRVMDTGAGFLCTACQWEMPLTHYEEQADNPVARRFWGLVPLEMATASLFFIAESDFREVLHSFKYRGRWALARDMGRWFGRVLADTDGYAGVDLIVPVPLHFRKVLKRGYNQSEYIARGMAASMGVPVENRAVERRVNNRSQTLAGSAEGRWENVEGIFAVRRPERLAGKHILLVDDVMTTGATIGSCAEAIFAAVNGTGYEREKDGTGSENVKTGSGSRSAEDAVSPLPPCRISIAVLYGSKQGLGVKE